MRRCRRSRRNGPNLTCSGSISANPIRSIQPNSGRISGPYHALGGIVHREPRETPWRSVIEFQRHLWRSDMTTALERDVTTALKRLAQQPHIVPETGTPPRSKLRWSRLVKLGGAFAILGLGAYAVLQDVAEITTDNAVVSAYTVALRTPIDGVVSTSIRGVGDRVNRGDVVADVTNVRVDDQRLVDLREHLMRVRSD